MCKGQSCSANDLNIASIGQMIFRSIQLIKDIKIILSTLGRGVRVVNIKTKKELLWANPRKS